MWAKNGARFLPTVLNRIDRVIPQEDVNRKIFVDDSSSDDSVGIAESFNWDIYVNEQGGICGGFNEALKRVASDYFVSIEQDVVLAKDWWDKIPKHMEKEKVAVAQGIRVPSQKLLRAIYEYKITARTDTSLDNNIWRTETIRKIGGFPTSRKFMADRFLLPKILHHGFEWVVDREVISIHIRESVKKTLEHHYGALLRAEIETASDLMDSVDLMKTLKNGSMRTIHIAFRENLPSIFYIYPFMCLLNYRSYLHRKSAIKGKKLEKGPKEERA